MAFTFEEWVDEHYNDNRPVEPCCAGENPEQWAQIADYAEKKLKTAFIAGQQSVLNNQQYDSTKDTLLHIKRVNELLLLFAKELMDRAICHDNSKLYDPEKPLFDKMTPLLKGLTYGSEEYKKSLAELKPALDHHYSHNSHHPEYYKDGINDCNLFDLVEMLCDWKAASERHADGNIFKSIQINKTRFAMAGQLAKIFENTVNKLFG
jgi:hypothetical protein|nr:MAG TPA: hypothetical protein [Caudoviricetes sp.]